MSSLKLKTSVVALAVAFSSAAAATDLPAYMIQAAQAMGATVAADGSISIGAMRLVPFMSAQYNAANVPAGATLADCTLHQDQVSYRCPGNLQFAFMQNTPGEMPHFSSGFAPILGYMLAADFSPPAGLVLPAGVTLANGVTIPPLTPAQMVAQMTSAGMLARGAVTFNADGTVTAIVNGVSTTYTPSRLPAHGQQGRYMPGLGYGVTVASGGTVTFPDGTTYVPRSSMMGGNYGMR